jgi:hypothetical protein
MCKPPGAHFKDETLWSKLPEIYRCALQILTRLLSDHVVAWNAASSTQFNTLLDISALPQGILAYSLKRRGTSKSQQQNNNNKCLTNQED